MEGSVQAGMHAHAWRDGQVCWSRPVVGVEFVDRPAINEALVCLVFAERGHEDVEVCQAHCPVGTVVDVREGDFCA